MEPPRRFQYRPICSSPGCRAEAVYKAGALWSDGARRELKNYGLACQEHREDQLARARENRNRLKLVVGESMGDVRLFRLDPGRRDSDLACVLEAEATTPAPDA